MVRLAFHFVVPPPLTYLFSLLSYVCFFSYPPFPPFSYPFLTFSVLTTSITFIQQQEQGLVALPQLQERVHSNFIPLFCHIQPSLVSTLPICNMGAETFMQFRYFFFSLLLTQCLLFSYVSVSSHLFNSSLLLVSFSLQCLETLE